MGTISRVSRKLLPVSVSFPLFLFPFFLYFFIFWFLKIFFRFHFFCPIKKKHKKCSSLLKILVTNVVVIFLISITVFMVESEFLSSTQLGRYHIWIVLKVCTFFVRVHYWLTKQKSWSVILFLPCSLEI